MSYQVIARKWRPQRFAEVHGQEHISRTLQHAIQRERVGHAYLFVGPRGIGKTTTARIFAKALNCSSPVTDAEGLPEPCCACQACLEITAGNCLDVLEIDGASNNSVDNIRDLRETVQYAPTNGRRYKIYIIDEVHMLTTQAWNALLKTLEEPPPHVKFLFATTEAHKVLPTVMSRCQRFDLKRISVAVIIRSLGTIAEQEKIVIDEAALGVIARAAEGGMRDAQSIFDQIIAFCGGTTEATRIHEEDVIEVFGLASGSELRQLAGALLRNDAAAMIELIHGLADRGRNLERLSADLLQVLRNLMIFQIAKQPERILELTSSELEEYQQLGGLAGGEVLQRLVEGMLEFEPRLRGALNKRVQLEAGLLRVARDAHSVTLDDLLTRLRTLHEQGALPPVPSETSPGPKGPEPVVAPVQAAPARPMAGPSGQWRPTPPVTAQPATPVPVPPPSRPTAPPSAQAPAPQAPALSNRPAPSAASAPAAPAAPGLVAPVAVAPTLPAPPAPVAAASAPPAAQVPEASEASDEQPPDEYYQTLDGREGDGDEGDSELAALPPRTVTLQESAAPRRATEVASAAQRHQAEALWHQAAARLAAFRPGDERWATAVAEIIPLGLDGDLLKLGFRHELVPAVRDYLQLSDTEKALRHLLLTVSGRAKLRLKIDPVMLDFERQRATLPSGDGRVSLFRQFEEHPLVRQVCELFDGKLVDVKNAPPASGASNPSP